MTESSLVVSLLVGSVAIPTEVATAERFENVEIRVIRPRYFNKRKKLELGGEMSGIMNETFIYTLLASGILTFHFTEQLAIEGGAALAFSIEKADKRILIDEFEIKTKIFKTKYLAWGSLLWTPIYGKWQLPSGRLIYFDTFLSLGYGMTGIEWVYTDFCQAPTSEDAEPLPPNATKSYPTILLGLGQRYFTSKKTAVRWDIKGHFLMYNRVDGECNPTDAEPGTGRHDNITLALGLSRFL